MTQYWCVNFDFEECLTYGIEHKLWMMQYQYEDDYGNRFQGGTQKSATTANWNRLKDIHDEDWFVAYLPKKRTATKNTFFAVGQVRIPRKPPSSPTHKPTVAQYVSAQRSHEFSSGVIHYTDAPVFYEDFDETWRFSDQLMAYVQRIDVKEWELHVADGVPWLSDLSIPPFEIQRAFFKIDKKSFDSIRKALTAAGGKSSKQTDHTQELHKVVATLEDGGYFDAKSVEDEQKKILRAVVQRQGQPKFRAKLIAAYEGRCAITGCDAEAALEAAHIIPYRGDKTDHVTNGLLLRADIHTLFDLNLIRIDPDSLIIALSTPLQGTSYGELEGASLTLPKSKKSHPSPDALREKWERFT